MIIDYLNTSKITKRNSLIKRYSTLYLNKFPSETISLLSILLITYLMQNRMSLKLYLQMIKVNDFVTHSTHARTMLKFIAPCGPR